MRIKRGQQKTQKRKKLLKQAKGYRGASSKLKRVANQAVMKAKKWKKPRFWRLLYQNDFR